METISINTEFIRLQDLLKLTGLAAKVRIQAGEASVNGEICLQRGKKLREGDVASFQGRSFRVVYAP